MREETTMNEGPLDLEVYRWLGFYRGIASAGENGIGGGLPRCAMEQEVRRPSDPWGDGWSRFHRPISHRRKKKTKTRVLDYADAMERWISDVLICLVIGLRSYERGAEDLSSRNIASGGKKEEGMQAFGVVICDFLRIVGSAARSTVGGLKWESAQVFRGKSP